MDKARGTQSLMTNLGGREGSARALIALVGYREKEVGERSLLGG